MMTRPKIITFQDDGNVRVHLKTVAEGRLVKKFLAWGNTLTILGEFVRARPIRVQQEGVRVKTSNPSNRELMSESKGELDTRYEIQVTLPNDTVRQRVKSQLREHEWVAVCAKLIHSTKFYAEADSVKVLHRVCQELSEGCDGSSSPTSSNGDLPRRRNRPTIIALSDDMCDFEHGEKLFESKQMMKKEDKRKEKHQSYKNSDPAYFLDQVLNKNNKAKAKAKKK